MTLQKFLGVDSERSDKRYCRTTCIHILKFIHKKINFMFKFRVPMNKRKHVLS